ncbi:MAG: quinoprotein glucose dehydrogenase [Sphingomonas bacterium]|nr:PQQ-binding-like beta-propeller repeat protein [Sphingomonas bacterium]MDB5690327.1 quinoprotein glucose dehydrogenase [Sphingomonas bacterium]
MRYRLLAALAAASLGTAAVAGSRPEKIEPGEWPRYTRDPAGTRFSPLAEINRGNVATLAQAWSFKVRPDGGGSIVSSATPIMVGGLLYMPVGNAVVALDPETGRQVWRHPVTGGTVRRAVSYWPGDKRHGPRIFYSTGKTLVALNARTGMVDTAFGTDGQLAIGVAYGYPPTIYRNVLIVGANTSEMPVGESGNTRAFDAVTGRKLWEFNTVPRPGEVGHETWLNDGWKGRSGNNVWIWYMTLDEKTGTLYMPVGGPSPNYDGTGRPGANLFGNSIVAVDAMTGRRKWHFQTIHHDLWDSDLPAPPTLVDITVNGRKIEALAETGKTGFMYILDRHTGKPVFGVDEKPVAAADVPGEWYSPTQPIPRKPEPLSRKTWSAADIVTAADTNAEHAAACRDLLASYGGTFFNSGAFTPFFLHEEGGPIKASINLPMNGGALWGGTAADPNTGLLYINTSEGGSIGFIEKRKAGADYGRGTANSNQTYDRASLSGPGAYTSFSASYKGADGRAITLPCIRPPWGRLIAVDANTGEIAWQTPLGVSDMLEEGKRKTGRNNGFGGPIVTAGGLVFIGATDDRRFRAFDAGTGQELWSTMLDYSAQAVPITYRGRNGRQFVVVTAANFGAGVRGADGKMRNDEALVAFALPQ